MSEFAWFAMLMLAYVASFSGGIVCGHFFWRALLGKFLAKRKAGGIWCGLCR
jgi:hypothetical protein